MKKLLFALLLAIIFALPAQAGIKPNDYNKPDAFLSGYFSTLPTTEERVYKALELIKIFHPGWEKSYDYGVFDCSEMSEYVRYFFTKCGISAVYCQSDGLNHCWIEVPDGKDKLLVESITLQIIPYQDWDIYYWYNDVRYNRPDMNYWEIDWWNCNF